MAGQRIFSFMGPVAVAALLVVLSVATAGGSVAHASAVATTERVTATLVADAVAAEPGRPVWVALRLDIADGWHTYWRNPGDSGEPTRIEWRLPDGVEASDIFWPAPERIPYGPLVNFGYHGRAVHLARITIPADWPADRPVELEAAASWLVCKDICIPEQADLAMTLPNGGGRSDPAAAAMIAAARDRLPEDYAGEARFGPQPAAAGAGQAARGDLILTLDPAGALADATSAYFFPATWGAVDPVAPQRLDRHGTALALTMTAGSEPPDAELNGVLVLNPDLARDDPDRRSYAVRATRSETVAGGASGAAAGLSGTAPGRGGGAEGGRIAAGPGLLVALVMALIGGLLLNVMPCVFPVLSMKAMGVIRHVSERNALRVSGLCYTAGILVFVGLVAGLLIGLKTAGEEIGWGFQLQAPAFVAVMALVIFALGLSLSGVFTLGASAMGWGNAALAGRSGSLGSFLAGALAALVATPCTAPFMGVALGFALTQPWPGALAVFLALGLGLALPYLVLTLVPGLAGWLPRPGVWMDRLKQLLAFPLYLTAAWLVWVLSLQAGAGAVFAVLVGLILIAFAAWLFESTRGLDGGRRRLADLAALAAGLAAIALATWPQAGAAPLPRAVGVPATADGGGVLAYEPFSPERLADLQADGIPTFVNLTAAWCITCQVNERIALSSRRIADAFRARGIIALKGDWTNRDPEITRLLDAFGRSGVPLYVLYRPGSEEPVILPQLLTEMSVMDAIGTLPVIAEEQELEKGSG
jgi:thiol:disulfide interchange protein/DsbC/DsbD-like thiol-disulfide interchange protein